MESETYAQWLQEATETGFSETPLWNAQMDFRFGMSLEAAKRPKDWWTAHSGRPDGVAK